MDSDFWISIRKWRFIVPIITKKDLLVADGEQRLTAAKALGMKEVSRAPQVFTSS